MGGEEEGSRRASLTQPKVGEIENCNFFPFFFNLQTQGLLFANLYFSLFVDMI